MRAMVTRPIHLVIVAALAVALPAAAAESTSRVGAAGAAEDCGHADPDGLEPPCNPHLAESVWSANHRTSFTQGSSPYPGPVGPAEAIDVHHAGMTAAPIVLQVSTAYPDGSRVVWGSTVGFTGQVFKLDAATHRIIDEYYPAFDGAEGLAAASPSGAYNVLDRDNRLIVAREQGLRVFGDDGDHLSPIELVHRFDLPEGELCRPDERDHLVGITMTYDGHVAFATRLGIVGVVPRQPAEMVPERLRTFSLNGETCRDGEVAEAELEEVANTLAADDEGGIYVHSSHATWRIDWDGERLTEAWRTPYQDDRRPGGRLGRGSNSSASVMGGPDDEHQLVAVYDNAEVFHLVLLWRDEIPADWDAIPGEDRRVACKHPVTFGRDEVEATFSEQSVLVRGYGALLVNDRMAADPLLSRVPNRFGGYTQIFGGLPGNAPRGMERIDWDPGTRTCASRWADASISIPNTIPTMSAETALVYAVGVRRGTWGLEALDWNTGERAFFVPSSPLLTSNSFWAATTIGPDGAIYSGTLGGVTRWRPCDPQDDDCGRRLSLVRAVVGEDGFGRVGWRIVLILGGVLLVVLLATAVFSHLGPEDS